MTELNFLMVNIFECCFYLKKILYLGVIQDENFKSDTYFYKKLKLVGPNIQKFRKRHKFGNVEK